MHFKLPLIIILTLVPKFAEATTAPCGSALSLGTSQNSEQHVEEVLSAYEFLLPMITEMLSPKELEGFVRPQAERVFVFPDKGGVRFGQIAEALKELEKHILALPLENQNEIISRIRETTAKHSSSTEEKKLELSNELRKQEKLHDYIDLMCSKPTPSFISFNDDGMLVCQRNSGPVQIQTWRSPLSANSQPDSSLHPYDGLAAFVFKSSRILFYTGRRLEWNNGQGGATQVKITAPNENITAFAESLDRNKLYFVSDHGFLYSIDRQGPATDSAFTKTRILDEKSTSNNIYILDFAVLQDERIVYTLSYSTHVYLWDPRSAVANHFETGFFSIKQMHVSQDNRLLVYGFGRGDLTFNKMLGLYDIREGIKSSRELLKYGYHDLQGATLSPDGRWVALYVEKGAKGAILLFDLMVSSDLDIPQPIETGFHKGADFSGFSFSPDSKKIAVPMTQNRRSFIRIFKLDRLPNLRDVFEKNNL